MNLQAKITGSLNLKQLNAALELHPKLSENGKTAARMVLVDGVSQVEVAEKLGVFRQQVSNWVKDVYKSHLDCPKGWQVDVVVLPPDLMSEVKEIERQARSSRKKKK
jgi:transposase-like protein